MDNPVFTGTVLFSFGDKNCIFVQRMKLADMKKLFVLIATVFIFSTAAFAQPKAIGGRVNGKFGAGVELMYQHWMPSSNRFIDTGLDIFFGTFGMSLSGVYDWIFASPGMWEFYAGPGAELTFKAGDGGFFAPGICGEIGAQLNVTNHFAVGLNWRPGVHLMVGKELKFGQSLADIGLSFVYCW